MREETTFVFRIKTETYVTIVKDDKIEMEIFHLTKKENVIILVLYGEGKRTALYIVFKANVRLVK